MKLKSNNVVLNRRGNYGAVVSFNDAPSLVVFAAYTMKLNRFDENLKCTNHDYDILEVYNGSEAAFADVMKAKFDPKSAGLKRTWKAKD